MWRGERLSDQDLDSRTAALRAAPLTRGSAKTLNIDIVNYDFPNISSLAESVLQVGIRRLKIPGAEKLASSKFVICSCKDSGLGRRAGTMAPFFVSRNGKRTGTLALIFFEELKGICK